MADRVLVVDQSLTIRMDLREVLADGGWRTALCSDAGEARAALAREAFAAILVDLDLPEDEGVELVRQVRATPATRELPVVALSSDRKAGTRIEAMGLSPDLFLEKPYERSGLLSRLGELIAATPRRPVTPEPVRILAVDDSLTFLERLADELVSDGYQVLTARSGEEALATLERQPVDLVLLDLVMPGMSGQEACRLIKQNWRATPVMMLTAHDDRDAMLANIAAGADDWLPKSADFEVLRARVRAQVRRLLAEREYRRVQDQLFKERMAAMEAHGARVLAEARAELLERLRRINDALERKNEELRRLSRRTEVVLDSAAEGICGLDDEGRVGFSNQAAAAICGLAQEALRGQVLCRLVHHDEHDPVDCPLFQPKHTGLRHEAEDHVFRLPDNREARIAFTASPIAGDPNLRVALVFRDVTRHRELEEQLRHAQKMEVVGRLAGGVAHDFNNLLTAIQGYGSVLRRKLPQDDPLAEYAEQILASARRAVSLTRQLLAFSRRQVMAPRVVDPNRLTEDMEPMLRRLLGDHIELDFDLGAAGRVKADPGHLEQVILNLALNARDAMPGGGRVHIGTRDVVAGEHLDEYVEGALPGGLYVVLLVRDEGEGIDPEARAHIFDPFFTTKASGSGLGLSTVHGIVVQSGGRVEVESEPGEGAEFRVYLPRVDEPADEVPDEVAAGHERVLVVDDEATVRQFVRDTLREAGYQVEDAGDPRQALSMVGEHGPPDLLLTDVVMPGMSGQELAAQLRDRHPELSVVFMSGYTAGISFPPNLAESDVAFLQKPFGAQDLAAAVRSVLDRRTERQEAAVRRRTRPPPE